MDLVDCLQRNQALIGNDCSRLGRFVKTGWLGYHKIFLAYDKHTGWNLVKLNFLQVFFRKLFGLFYKQNTLLNHVASRWHKCQVTRHPLVEACQARIQAQWNKKYLIGLGNADLSHAQVICFAEEHTDKAFKASEAHFLDTHYREGDVILVSALEAGQTKSSREQKQLQLAKRDYQVQGWEPTNFAALMGRPYALHQDYKRELANCNNRVNTLFQAPLTADQLSRCEQELKDIVKKIGELNVYYQSRSPLVIKVEASTRSLMDNMKAQGITPNRQEELRTALLKALNKLEDNKTKAIYGNLTPVDQHTILQAHEPRAASLVQQIANARAMNKRVWVIGGALNLLNTTTSNAQTVREELKRHSFLILTNKAYSRKFDITPESNADLTPQTLA